MTKFDLYKGEKNIRRLFSLGCEGLIPCPFYVIALLRDNADIRSTRADMKSEEVDYIEELNNLPVDSIRIAPYLSELKQKAAAEVSIRHLNLTDTFLIQFLQARDFDVALALKVCNTTIKR